MLKTFLFKNH